MAITFHQEGVHGNFNWELWHNPDGSATLYVRHCEYQNDPCKGQELVKSATFKIMNELEVYKPASEDWNHSGGFVSIKVYPNPIEECEDDAE